MSAARGSREFDEVQFRKFMRLMDSDVVAERNAALNQAIKLCSLHVPPLLFCEAASLVFGTGREDTSRIEAERVRLAGQVEDLEVQLQQRINQAAEVSARFLEAQATIKDLTEKKAGQEEKMVELPQWLSDFLRKPPVILGLVTSALSFDIWMCGQFEHYPNPVLEVIANLCLLPVPIQMLPAWVRRQYQKDGPLQLIIKGTIMGAGIVTTIYSLADKWPTWSDFLARGGPQVTNPGFSICILGWSYLIAISRLSELLVDDGITPLWDRYVRRVF